MGQAFQISEPIADRVLGSAIYLGATVLLPAGYDDETMRYPVLYHQGHFSLRPPLGFDVGAALHAAWVGRISLEWSS